jgi:hypothetical protein
MVYPVRTRKSPETVVFTYRPAKDPKDVKAKIDGDAIAVELMPRDFQLSLRSPHPAVTGAPESFQAFQPPAIDQTFV